MKRIFFCSIIAVLSAFLCGCEGKNSPYEIGYEDGVDYVLSNLYEYDEVDKYINDYWYDYISIKDVVNEYAYDYDYVSKYDIWEYIEFSEEDYKDIMFDHGYECGYVYFEDIADELIDAGEYTALDSLRNAYYDSFIFGDYVLDIQNNIIHYTYGDCSEKIDSNNIRSVSLFWALEENCNICSCIPKDKLDNAIH